MLWALDTRVRNIEGQIPSFFLTEEDALLVPALTAANATYDSRHSKGSAHPDGPRRTSLAAKLLITLSKADLKRASPTVVQAIAFHDQIALLSKSPSITEQQTLLVELLKSYTTAKHMEPEVTQCLFFATKKPNKAGKKRFFFSLPFSPMSMLRHTMDFVRICLLEVGAEFVDGPPPLGPTIREIPRHR